MMGIVRVLNVFPRKLLGVKVKQFPI